MDWVQNSPPDVQCSIVHYERLFEPFPIFPGVVLPVGEYRYTRGITHLTTAGKRRAVKHVGGRGPLLKGFPSAPVLMGIAALADRVVLL